MSRIAFAAFLGGMLLTSLPALAQTPGQFLTTPAAPSLPPSVAVAPGTTPSPSQQLQMQNYRNQLELQQRPSAATNPQGFGNQLNAGEQLNQLNLQSR